MVASSAPAISAGERCHAETPDAEREQDDGDAAGDLADQPRLPHADAEGREREYSSAGEDRRNIDRVPFVLAPFAEEGLVAGVVHPGAFVVPHDADGRIPWRVGGGEEAAHQRGPYQDHEKTGCEMIARSVRTNQFTRTGITKTLLNAFTTELRANTTSV